MPPKSRSRALSILYKDKRALYPCLDGQSNSLHANQSNGSVRSNIPILFPSFTSKKRRTVYQAQTPGVNSNRVEDVEHTHVSFNALGANSNRVEDVEHTPVSFNALGDNSNRVEDVEHTPLSLNALGVECPLQPSNEVRNGNAEEILESNSSHVEVSTTSTNSKARKTRGPTSKSASNPPKGQKWRCMFIDQQPVGEEASKLAEVLGLYARNDNYFPPHKEWKEQSKQSFNDVMKEILVEYDFVDKEGLPASMTHVTKFCEASISSKVKEWRAALKRAGYMKGVDGELSETPPNERISEASWNSLLQYWSNPKKIQEIERNRKNRAEEQAIHTLGAKSIARHNHEQRQKLGDNYSTLGAYLTAHQMKGGEYPNEYTRDICEKVIAICEERNIGNSLEPTVLAPVLDDVYNGHHGGYERGRGIGWSRGAWKYNMSNEVSNDNIRRLTTDLENTQSKLQNAMAEIEGMRAHESEMKERQEEHMEAMLARERGLEVRLQEQEEAMQAREQEMQAQLKQMEAMVSMCLSNASVGERRLHNAHASSSQPPRK